MNSPPLEPDFTYSPELWLRRAAQYEFPEVNDPEAWRHPSYPALLDRYRQEHEADFRDIPSIPKDVFAFGLGKPRRPDVTQFGGVPYRSSAADWPLDDNGEAMTFLLQIRVAESVDLLGPLPGDLLLVLSNDHYVPDFNTEWSSFGISDLVRSEMIPRPKRTIPNCWGVRHRTKNFISKIDPALRGYDRIPFGYIAYGGITISPAEVEPGGEPGAVATIAVIGVEPLSGYAFPWINSENTPASGSRREKPVRFPFDSHILVMDVFPGGEIQYGWW